MKLFRVWILLPAFWLAACVTTTTGDVPVPASSKEAAEINMNLGIQYLQKGKYEQAMEKLRKSIDENPDNATAHWALGLVYEQLGDANEAEDEFRIAVRQAPDDPETLNQMASFLCRQGKQEEALKYFDRALKIPLNTRRYTVATNAGTCAKNSDLDLAESYLRDALASQPNFPDALYQMGEVAYRQENFLQARAFIERRLAAAPASSPVLWLAYRTEKALGDSAAADRYATKLLNNYPTSVEARLLLEARRDDA